MLLLTCPHCGPRDEIEFSHGGEAGRSRPRHPDALDDGAWAAYLFMRVNPRGRRRERWRHSAGCGRWFEVERDTVSHALSDFKA